MCGEGEGEGLTVGGVRTDGVAVAALAEDVAERSAGDIAEPAVAAPPPTRRVGLGDPPLLGSPVGGTARPYTEAAAAAEIWELLLRRMRAREGAGGCGCSCGGCGCGSCPPAFAWEASGDRLEVLAREAGLEGAL